MASIQKIVGLTSDRAKKALEKHGPNELKEKRKMTAFKVFFRQFTNVIVWILIVATLISYGVGETINFWVINTIIGFVICMGFLQEFKAERAMEVLRKIVRPQTNVIRDERLMTIDAKEVVPEDILALEMGSRVPADARLVHSTNAEVDESMLTGESAPVHKKKGDLIYAGTQLVNGRCQAQVVATGMKTKLGKIAQMIQETQEITPLQKRMGHLGKFLAVIALSASMLILILGIARGASRMEMLMVALALAVAAVPEGLPLTMTLALSHGMHKMAKKNAIVRRMTAVETLGSTTVICTDKTGTLTKNEMTVQKLYIDNGIISVTGVGYRPNGTFKQDDEIVDITPWKTFFKAGVLCNNSDIFKAGPNNWVPIGDPTEVAFITLGAKANLNKKELDEAHRRVEEIMFTSERKMMTTIHKDRKGYTIYSKGAPEEILKRCTHQLVKGELRKLSPEDREKILKQNRDFAGKALRVLALATKTYDTKKTPTKNMEKGLAFLGLAAMRDPYRPEAKEALEKCKRAGIRTIMITGDNEDTAVSIAKQIGLTNGKEEAMTGKAIDKLNNEQLRQKLKRVSIFARTQPEHKLRIVTLLKEEGEVVAMTGDGINDAPALKKADIGIAMGIKGTDV
ncbi:MAG: HAD-IC family P-type ATPase, partial [Candidatus Peregrinibacteria bacterium]